MASLEATILPSYWTLALIVALLVLVELFAPAVTTPVVEFKLNPLGKETLI